MSTNATPNPVPENNEAPKAEEVKYTLAEAQALNKKFTYRLPFFWSKFVAVCGAIDLVMAFGLLPVRTNMLTVLFCVILAVCWYFGVKNAQEGAQKSKRKSFENARLAFAAAGVLSIILFRKVGGALSAPFALLFFLLKVNLPLGVVFSLANLVIACMGIYHCYEALKHVVDIPEEEAPAAEEASGESNTQPDTKGKIVMTYNQLGKVVIGISALLIIFGILTHELAFIALLGLLGVGAGFLCLHLDDAAVKNRTSQKVTISMKGVLIAVAVIVAIAALIALMPSQRSSSSHSSGTGYGGYNMPNSSHSSVSDYIRDEDPELWNTMQDRWNSLGN